MPVAANLFMQTEPLKPDPNWKRINSPFWQSETGSAMLSDHGPADYARGFEDGAFALADELLKIAEAGDLRELVSVLHRYNSRLAHPAKGWQHEPVRG